MTGQEDITPEGSASPVFFDPTEAPGEDATIPDFAAAVAAREAEREAGVAEIMSSLNLSEGTARAMMGLPVSGN